MDKAPDIEAVKARLAERVDMQAVAADCERRIEAAYAPEMAEWARRFERRNEEPIPANLNRMIRNALGARSNAKRFQGEADDLSALLADHTRQAEEIARLREAITGIHQARIRNTRDEGWGWDIGMLNLAMNVALPLIDQPRPEQTTPEERAALRAKFQAILDADRTALQATQSTGASA